MKTPINHLGSRLERQSHYRLPLQAKLLALDKYTRLVKQTLMNVLPSEAISGLRVIVCENQQLIITANNHTIANHLNYMSQSILDLLHHEHPELLSITQLKFRVVLMNQQFSKAATSSMALQRNSIVNTVTFCELSDLTKQNITQLANLVTTNKKLAEILHKIAQSPNDKVTM